MLDIRFIRENPELVRENIRKMFPCKGVIAFFLPQSRRWMQWVGHPSTQAPQLVHLS